MRERERDVSVHRMSFDCMYRYLSTSHLHLSGVRSLFFLQIPRSVVHSLVSLFSDVYMSVQLCLC